MIVKRSVGLPNSCESDNVGDDDNYMMARCDSYALSGTLGGFSKPRPLTLKPKRCGKQSSMGKLKNKRSTILSMKKKLEGDHQSGHSLLVPSHQGEAVPCSKSWEDHGSTTDQTSVGSGFEKSLCELANQRDLDAAHALMKLANERPGLARNGSPSFETKNIKKRMPRIKVSKGKVKSNRLLDGICSQVERSEANVKKFQKEDNELLHLPLSTLAYPSRKKAKKRKVGDELSSVRVKDMNNNVSEEDMPVKTKFFRSRSQKVLEEPPYIPMKKRVSQKLDADFDSLDGLATNSLYLGKGIADDAVPLKKPTGFSFSILHLLTAIRTAMISRPAEDGRNTSKTKSKTLPSLTLDEIVKRVRSNPLDPCILQTHEPLHDLIRGVLKIFSSKTAPLGAKGWKQLAFYDKPVKQWSWIGPVTFSSYTAIEEMITSEAWGLPQRMLVKLVDSFSSWLESGQERIHQVRSLPEPPLVLMHLACDTSERLMGLKCRKSITTITSSPIEVRAYFRKEEALRYLIPDRAFSYTALDGRKSTVSPLRRCSGKPSYRRREHFMLKADRPPHVTVLCLVRDAAARLPGSVGTRADVCTLVRDSEYIVEDLSDEQLSPVVSGALDRLHYESDPCVRFDGDRKLWVYLHGDREEEDFEDDGTSSTRKRFEKMC